MAGDSGSDDKADCIAVIADIATLARTLAAAAPLQSVSGPEALLALAAYLDGIVTTTEPAPSNVVQIAVWSRRKTGDA